MGNDLKQGAVRGSAGRVRQGKNSIIGVPAKRQDSTIASNFVAPWRATSSKKICVESVRRYPGVRFAILCAT